jgi:uncharacterized phage protein gp47/JayE
MPFARPSLTALRNTAIQDITTSGVPGLTGLLRAAVLRVLAWCMAGLAYAVYGYADWIARMGVPFTAEDEYLQAWAALVGIYPLPSTPSIGTATFAGNANTALLADTPLVREDGTAFVVTGDAAVDATGAVTVPIQATVNGAFTNDPGGTPISIATPIAGINSAGVTGLCTGGADVETNDALRTRMLVKYREPPQGGATADYINWSLEVPGCTRAWVVGQGYGPGSVAVFPMFDDVEAAHGGFPQGTDGLASEETRPGPTATGDQGAVAEHIWTVQPITSLVYVAAALPFPVDVTLNGLDPNTADMQAQIVASLNDMFLAVGEINGVIWPSDLYEAILATPGINHFEMSVPADAVQAGPGQLPVLGTLTTPLPSP